MEFDLLLTACLASNGIKKTVYTRYDILSKKVFVCAMRRVESYSKGIVINRK